MQPGISSIDEGRSDLALIGTLATVSGRSDRHGKARGWVDRAADAVDSTVYG